MLNNSKIIALLPMKVHSERIPGKNFRMFCGKPLFQWILDTLLSLSEITKVVINTDARSILESCNVVDSERIMIRDRKSELCGDYISMNNILEDDVVNVTADIYLMTHVTNPLLSKPTIHKTLEVYCRAQNDGEADSLFTVNRFQSRFYRFDCSAVNHDPNNLIRTQDLEPLYEENSSLYIFSRDSLTKTQGRIGKKPIMFEISRFESIDIDDQESWDLAELVAQATL